MSLSGPQKFCSSTFGICPPFCAILCSQAYRPWKGSPRVFEAPPHGFGEVLQGLGEFPQGFWEMFQGLGVWGRLPQALGSLPKALGKPLQGLGGPLPRLWGGGPRPGGASPRLWRAFPMRISWGKVDPLIVLSNVAKKGLPTGSSNRALFSDGTSLLDAAASMTTLKRSKIKKYMICCFTFCPKKLRLVKEFTEFWLKSVAISAQRANVFRASPSAFQVRLKLPCLCSLQCRLLPASLTSPTANQKLMLRLRPRLPLLRLSALRCRRLS